MKLEYRVAALERQVAELQDFAALRPWRQPEQRQEQQVKIGAPALPRLAMPNADQLDQLLTIVLRQYPALRARDDEPDDFRAQFRSAFTRLMHCGRRDKVDTERTLSWWCDDAREWCRQHHVNPSWVGGGALVASALAHGDIPFTSLDAWPHISLGLQFGGGGREPLGKWHTVLTTGKLLEPMPPQHPVKLRA